jgi:hypothetical protein
MVSEICDATSWQKNLPKQVGEAWSLLGHREAVGSWAQGVWLWGQYGIGAGLVSKAMWKQNKGTPSTGGRQTQEGALHWGQRPEAFIGVCRDGVASPEKLGYVLLTLRDWTTCHQLLPHVDQGDFLP